MNLNLFSLNYYKEHTWTRCSTRTLKHIMSQQHPSKQKRKKYRKLIITRQFGLCVIFIANGKYFQQLFELTWKKNEFDIVFFTQKISTQVCTLCCEFSDQDYKQNGGCHWFRLIDYDWLIDWLTSSYRDRIKMIHLYAHNEIMWVPFPLTLTLALALESCCATYL